MHLNCQCVGHECQISIHTWQILNNAESSYRKEIVSLAETTSYSTSAKTKELMQDLRMKEAKTLNPVYISGAEVEVNSFRWKSQRTDHGRITSPTYEKKRRHFFLSKFKCAYTQKKQYATFKANFGFNIKQTWQENVQSSTETLTHRICILYKQRCVYFKIPQMQYSLVINCNESNLLLLNTVLGRCEINFYKLNTRTSFI